MQEASSKRPNLSHEFKAFVEKTNKTLNTPFIDMNADEIRKNFEAMQAEYKYDIPAEIEDIEVQTKEAKISVRIVRPENAEGELPVVYYMHGGGWVAGSAESYDRFLRMLAKETGCAIVFPGYSLSPEVKYPAAVNECYEVLKYIYEHGEEHKLKKDKIITAGDSAGGNMAAVMTLMAREKKDIKIIFQILLTPLTDWNLATGTMEEFADGPYITKEKLIWHRYQYLTNKGERDDIYASPLVTNYDKMTGLPPALIITAENDPLRDDGEAYARRLNKADVPVTCVRYNGAIHLFMIFNALADTQISKRASEQICACIKNVIQ